MEESRGKGLLLWVAGSRETAICLFIILLIIVVSLRSPYFLTIKNLEDILLNIAVLSIVATGQMMVITSGGIDLSVGSALALSGMIVGMTVSENWHLPPLLALLMGMGLGIVLGSFNGLLVAKGRVPPIIATLGTMSVYRGLTFVVSGGAWVDAHELPDSFKQFARDTVLGVPNLVLLMIIVAIIFYYFLNHTRTGRQVYAVGSNPSAARVVGINVNRILFMVFLLSGLLSGMGGVLWVSRYASAQSDSAMGFELQTVAAAVIGGVSIAGGSGTIPGLLLGSLLLGILINALTLVRVSPFWQLAMQGMVILIAVVSNAAMSRRLQRVSARRRKA
ncbi:ribose transport system permease protein [Candidatus Hakubella thermalkaliphila]|uniref:Ribose transport system permease protein n=1 Tax=Candidatus Hakubella thermalkaliphila TaxID=2754717 RepID=A0A6V8PUZ2_9ACTN|nr:ribose transport system permease protein [Candidatus Hakubella thermalkaliphila]GFP22740.1 ribose transport system permease protein [Candidatus Hakubella thermalkaliphila]GFP36412.1 ribose transport system permease protein [Candidatus Hakubella thermalkaliphila]